MTMIERINEAVFSRPLESVEGELCHQTEAKKIKI